VPLPEGNDNERCIERIRTFCERVAAAGSRPVSIGGDHSITGGIVRGLTGPSSQLSDGKAVALVHVDAHIDAYDALPHLFGAIDSAAHWAGYLVREGRVDAAHSVQIGIRGNPRTLGWLDPSRELGYDLIPMREYRALGGAACVERIRPWRRPSRISSPPTAAGASTRPSSCSGGCAAWTWSAATSCA
jgi:guanidinopropionase